MPKQTCRGTTKAGEPCQSPFVGEDGLCGAHAPGAEERMKLRGHQGAKASAAARKARTKGLDPDELPAVATSDDPHQAAMQAIEIVIHAVGQERLGHTVGRVMIQGYTDILDIHEKGVVSERLGSLLDAVAQWKKTGDPAPVLELVKGAAS